MAITDLLELLNLEYSASFSGWDFSHVSGRMQEDILPWNYRKTVEEHFKDTQTLLDIDTGGGEFLDSFANLPPITYATEAYAPNVPIATTRLAKRDIAVKVITEDKRLPFEDSFFDLIICRHGSFSFEEVVRVLKPGGLFVTQQVGSLNAIDLNASLGAINKPIHDWCLTGAISNSRKQNFILRSHGEHLGKYRFYDIGAIVYYLKCIPWQIEDFSVEKYYPRLAILNDVINMDGYKDIISHRFFAVFQKGICT